MGGGWIPDKDGEGAVIYKRKVFDDPDNFRARFTGLIGQATAGQSTNIELQIAAERYINGVRLILDGHTVDDTLHFEIVDKDGIGVALGWYTQQQFDAMGEYVADRFGQDWNIDHTIATQPDVIVPYPAKIYAGLYVRIIYNSAGQSNVKVKANLYLHWKSA